jgi:D-alanine-D-alanine ligase
MSKVRVGIIFGGRSAEHEVSLQSARNIVDALDRSRFEPVLIGIDKAGHWHLKKTKKYVKRRSEIVKKS